MHPHPCAGAYEIVVIKIERRIHDVSLFIDFERITIPPVPFKGAFDSGRDFSRIARPGCVNNQTFFLCHNEPPNIR
jgi:hypothetical protein